MLEASEDPVMERRVRTLRGVPTIAGERYEDVIEFYPEAEDGG